MYKDYRNSYICICLQTVSWRFLSNHWEKFVPMIGEKSSWNSLYTNTDKWTLWINELLLSLCIKLSIEHSITCDSRIIWVIFMGVYSYFIALRAVHLKQCGTDASNWGYLIQGYTLSSFHLFKYGVRLSCFMVSEHFDNWKLKAIIIVPWRKWSLTDISVVVCFFFKSQEHLKQIVAVTHFCSVAMYLVLQLVFWNQETLQKWRKLWYFPFKDYLIEGADYTDDHLYTDDHCGGSLMWGNGGGNKGLTSALYIDDHCGGSLMWGNGGAIRGWLVHCI